MFVHVDAHICIYTNIYTILHSAFPDITKYLAIFFPIASFSININKEKKKKGTLIVRRTKIL